ncbi:UNVERIFIED_CONTAM: hypothetical protein Sradi_3622100 [Sesamum radiatum]|uniref:Uncharacterized protein n=1 Tax=Sesamum radiatum TaxID=300843 RepID=A0AAW2QHU4_SESRA
MDKVASSLELARYLARSLTASSQGASLLDHELTGRELTSLLTAGRRKSLVFREGKFDLQESLLERILPITPHLE